MQIELNYILLAPYPTFLSVLPDTHYPSKFYIQLGASFLPDKSQNHVSFQGQDFETDVIWPLAAMWSSVLSLCRCFFPQSYFFGPSWTVESLALYNQ